MGMAIVHFDIKMILHELGFPNDTEVRSFWHERDNPLEINIAVIHPELPDNKEGNKLPRITPLFLRPKINEQAKLVNWGHPELR